MHLQARRVFRLSAVLAGSLALGYALALPLPFIAPVFAFMLTATPGPPMGLKALFGLVLVLLLTTGVGLLLIPFLIHYPVTGVLRWVTSEAVAVALYGPNWNQMIDDVNVAFFVTYTIGDPITEADVGLE